MKIRKGTLEEIDKIMNIISVAKKYMIDTGNYHQWIDGYPSVEVIENDIRKGNCYIIENADKKELGTFCYIEGDDPTYEKIYDGKWLNDKPYGVIHRLASNGEEKGIAKICLDWCYKRCKNIRIDTHKKNQTLQNVLIKEGFTYCGTIIIENGTERIAFQKA